ncbi:hypothetical protein IFR05_010848 [Cadophora sp. M221]|nr:hypothetical protein IFR05_010848 [Cadophora sp. M221]
MGGIYKNPAITIVAASAEVVSEGFLDSTALEPTAKLPMFINDSTTAIVYLRSSRQRDESSEDEPSFRRAWTPQEFLLSPRSLVFTSTQIVFHCRQFKFQSILKTYLDCEFQTGGTLPASIFGLVDDNESPLEGRETERGCLGEKELQLRKSLVECYSSKSLTNPEDCLPALAGIAAELSISWGGALYLAGFWENIIVEQLGWRRKDRIAEITGVDSPKRIGAPSWSWVSVPFAVDIKTLSRRDARLLGSSVQLLSEQSPFGQIREASITIEARIIKAGDSKVALSFSCILMGRVGLDENSMALDFGERVPDRNKCALLYLGERDQNSIFLVMGRNENEQSQRVGTATLDIRKRGWGFFDPKNNKREWEEYLNSVPRKTITIW